MTENETEFFESIFEEEKRKEKEYAEWEKDFRETCEDKISRGATIGYTYDFEINGIRRLGFGMMNEYENPWWILEREGAKYHAGWSIIENGKATPALGEKANRYRFAKTAPGTHFEYKKTYEKLPEIPKYGWYSGIKCKIF